MKILTSACLLLIIILGGCATDPTYIKHSAKDNFQKSYTEVDVRPVKDYSGYEGEFDIAKKMTILIKSALRDKGYTIIEKETANEDALILESRLLNYKPGSAFDRWLMPGAGATQVTMKTIMTDMKTGNQIGDIVTNKSVSVGGLFTVGAEEWILESVAKDLIKEIERRNKAE